MSDNPVQVSKPRSLLTRRSTIILLIIVFACIGTLGGSVFFALRLTAPAADAASDFLVATRDEDYDAAFAMMTPELQETLGGSPQGYSDNLEAGGIDLDSWTIASREVDGDEGLIQGEYTLADGTTARYRIILINEDGWQIDGYSFFVDDSDSSENE